MISSSTLYNTFGNEIKTKIVQDTLISYLENATVKFVLPEASVSLLTTLTTGSTENIDPVMLDQVTQQLITQGFNEANAKTLAIVLVRVAKRAGISPIEYFNLNQSSLELAVGTYNLINEQRPAGNRIGLVLPTNNGESSAGSLIKP